MRTLAALLCLACLAGCIRVPVAPAPVIPTVLRNDVGRLREHPEYRAAIKAAPDFTRAAMETIARLDHELNQPR